MTEGGAIRVGISGWTYAPWRGVFYPKGLRHKDELSFAARQVNSIEINGSFYALQKPAHYAAWAAAVPEDFVFAVKGPRFITHLRRLNDVAVPLANFWASGLFALGPKLGPILWQLPPNFAFDPERLGRFFEMLPRDTEAAARQARHHDARLDGRALTEAGPRRPLRHAIEIRHDSFRDEAFLRLLREHQLALVCADTVAWPRLMDVTADFMYVRLHGSEQLYASGYDDRSLDDWARRVRAWAAGRQPRDAERIGPPATERRPRDVYVYFDNDMKSRAPVDARGLMQRLKVTPSRDPAPAEAS